VIAATHSVTAPTADTSGTVSATASFNGGASHFRRGGGDPGVVQNTAAPVTVVSAPVEINEVQTGTATTPNQQFVELYNSGASPATLPSGTTIAPGGYYLIGGAGYASAGTQPPDNQSFTQTSTTELSPTGGGIAIADSTGFVADSIGYGVNANSGYALSAYQRSSNAFTESCPVQSYGVVPTVT
jgi:hypothetical protein